MTSWLPSQRASDAESVYLSLRHRKIWIDTSYWPKMTTSEFSFDMQSQCHTQNHKWKRTMLSISNVCFYRATMFLTWWRHQMEAFCARNSPVTCEFPIQRSVTRSLVFSLICAWINGWVNNREADDLRKYRAQYDATAMFIWKSTFEWGMASNSCCWLSRSPLTWVSLCNTFQWVSARKS